MILSMETRFDCLMSVAVEEACLVLGAALLVFVVWVFSIVGGL